jgi:MFS family permease
VSGSETTLAHDSGDAAGIGGRRGATAVWRDANLQVILIVTLVVNMGLANVVAAFPLIGTHFDQSPQAVGLLITAFTVPGILLTPVLGILADRWGRRRVLVPSLMVFGLAGGGCALARDFRALLALRFVQGVGVSALGPLCVTIITDLYDGRAHTTAMGYYSSVLTVASAGYSVIGGALAILGWQYPFAIHFLGIPVALLAARSLRNPEPRGNQQFGEYLRQLWIGVRRPQVLRLFAACLVAFIFVFGAYYNYLPFLMEETFGASPLVIGIAQSGTSLVSAITSSQLGRLTGRWSQRSLLGLVFALYAVALPLVPLAPRLWTLAIPVVLFGVSTGLFIPVFLTMTARLAPTEHRSALVAANEMVLFAGQSIGPVLIGAAFGLWGLGGAFYAGFPLAVVGLLLVAKL